MVYVLGCRGTFTCFVFLIWKKKIPFIVSNLFIKFNHYSTSAAQSLFIYISYNKNITFIPAISYFNADLERYAIIKQNRNKSGIYRSINMVNNKTYIGSSLNLASLLH